MRQLLVLHGPNLGELGRREPHVYGTLTLAELNTRLEQLGQTLGLCVTCMQSNHEGALIDALAHAHDAYAGVVLNPGGLAHTSVVLRDAIAASPLEVIEVHLSNVHAREPFRHTLLTAGCARGVISGLGPLSYELALRYFSNVLQP